MTPTRRGRGRPALFHPAARDTYLTARAAGDTQEKAAAGAGVAAKTVRDARRTDPAFRALDDAAAATAKDTALRRYLTARAAGAAQRPAAAEAGLNIKTVQAIRRDNPAFRARDDAVSARARQTRIEDRHDEYRYVHFGCRCPVCTADATAKRAARRERGSEEAPVVAISPTGRGSPKDLLLARAS